MRSDTLKHNPQWFEWIWMHRHQNRKKRNNTLGKIHLFLVADTQLYKRLCLSVRRSIGPSVRRSIGPSVRRSIGPSVLRSISPLVRGHRVEKWENERFWAAAPKGTKSCRTPGESVRQSVCTYVCPSIPPAPFSGLCLLWGLF